LHELLVGDAWLVGRVTGQESAKAETYLITRKTYRREPWFARRDAEAYGVVLDAHGKIAWGRSNIGGDPIVAVLTEQVSDARLAGLRGDGVLRDRRDEKRASIRMRTCRRMRVSPHCGGTPPNTFKAVRWRIHSPPRRGPDRRRSEPHPAVILNA
jgi:hypothetical protein